MSKTYTGVVNRAYVRGQVIYNSVRSLLKENTAGLHHQAEEAFEAKACLESPDGVSNFLSCMLKAHQHFGAESDRASNLVGIDPLSVELVTALQLDLHLPVDYALRSSACTDQFSLGVGYVFEGSALGAQIIKKRLTASGIPNPKYLDLMTSTAKARWPRYVEKLDNYRDGDGILSGAVAAFEFIIDQAESIR